MATTTTNCGLLRFTVPDLSIPAEERGLFAFAASKEVVEEKMQLHNFWTDRNVAKGIQGLDVQGFTYLNHPSALSSEEWFEGNNIEEVYIPELTALLIKELGAKSAVVNSVAIRRKLADEQADPKFYLRKGCELDQEIAKLPTDVPFVYGKEAGGSLEPARAAHVDYSIDGLRRTVRECRRDICEAAESQLSAEDRGDPQIPRYAAYSVWRPLQTVHRDPLAVCDWRSVKRSEVVPTPYRALSNVNESGEYMMEALGCLPPKDPSSQRWYWVPEQQPDEVLIVKFGDTAADEDPTIAAFCAHASPIIPGTEHEEVRCSIEARVLVFW